MSFKLLILGPGAPDRNTSGLGKAAHHIAEELSKKISLTLVEPSKIEELNVKQKVAETSNFSDLSVLKEMATVSIESQLSAYHYQEVTHSNTQEKIESHRLHQQLVEFSNELVLEGQEIDFDAIYAHDWITFKAALELKEKFAKPLLLHVHSLDVDRNFGQHGSWIFDLEQNAMQQADAVIAVSHYSKSVIIEQYGIAEDKIHVIYHGHHPETPIKVKSPFEEKIVLFVGRLAGQKGPMQFLEIAEKIAQEYPETRFVMSGDGELYKRLIEAGAGSAIASRFHITGHLDQDDLKKLYAIADVYCMPSFSEPFGLTALEAASAGVPMVLSDRCGAAEILPEATLVSPEDTDMFASKIVSILQNPKLSMHAVAVNQEQIKNLTWERSASKILAVLESII
ncbi:MAG: glycosyltransferase family 4 protein [Reichenbachiella sp.]|uniref:glycosyltransferase family 4 protein n=1 Tax=Reichenbachiella sp. TaxID=2184521 RepID=UPI00326383EA